VGVSHWIEIEVEEAAAAITFRGCEGAGQGWREVLNEI